MNEMETLQRAKMYIDKMAQGINPIDDSPAGEGDVINNIRVSRCLFYVSDVLRQVIDNGGSFTYGNRVSSGKKLPFSVSDEALDGFQYSSKPIPISEIARRITALVDENTYQNMKYTKIRDWLVSVEMLSTSVLPNGKTSYAPTEAGIAAGIGVEMRNGSTGTYSVTVYSIEAQQFIIDNLQAILATQ